MLGDGGTKKDGRRKTVVDLTIAFIHTECNGNQVSVPLAHTTITRGSVELRFFAVKF